MEDHFIHTPSQSIQALLNFISSISLKIQAVELKLHASLERCHYSFQILLKIPKNAEREKINTSDRIFFSFVEKHTSVLEG